jgi:predicted RNase H-like HicB family nuclease
VSERRQLRYAVIIERGTSGYGAYVPDLPGVISVGDTEQQVTANIQEAIALHLEGLRDVGGPIPEPRSSVAVVDAV